MSNTAHDSLPRHRLSLEDYHRMAQTGILREDQRVELIEGEIIDMTPIGSWHAGIVAQLSLCREPTPDGYRQMTTPDDMTAISPLCFPDMRLDLRALFE